uniref:Uncharacterized protein n=1 Tax=Panagrolaimus superbus TaxID=310955 RepID=A0A914YUG8_9BILA
MNGWLRPILSKSQQVSFDRVLQSKIHHYRHTITQHKAVEMNRKRQEDAVDATTAVHLGHTQAVAKTNYVGSQDHHLIARIMPDKVSMLKELHDNTDWCRAM